MQRMRINGPPQQMLGRTKSYAVATQTVASAGPPIAGAMFSSSTQSTSSPTGRAGPPASAS